MGIRNLMEDEVVRLIDEICDEDEASGTFGYCTLPECRMDAACFVLNRVPQRYVTSDRGIARFDTDLTDDAQLSVDLVTLAHDGLRRVSTVRRSFYSDDAATEPPPRQGPAFCFPVIRGRIFDGTTFSKISGVRLALLADGSPVGMANARWQNPFEINENNPGSYLFWPAPLPAESDGMRRSFEFDLALEDESRFEPFHHLFSIETTSQEGGDQVRMSRDFSLQDLFLVPR